jgi:hypothetical protein
MHTGMVGEVGRPTAVLERLRGRLGSVVIMSHAIERFPRTRWLHRGRGVVPRPPLRFMEPSAVTSDDVTLCVRLLAAYERAGAEMPRLSGMWMSDLFRHRHRLLHEALDSQDPERLAELLGVMFRSDIVVGMAMGSFGLKNLWYGTRWFWSMSMVEQLLALAESQGVVRSENPEQDKVARPLRVGLEEIVTTLERKLKAGLDFPNIGGAYGIDVAGRLITPDWPDQIYGAARLVDAIDRLLPEGGTPRVVEIGAGYGGMALWLTRLCTDAQITLIDLPLVNVMQGYFLGRVAGSDSVSLYGERARKISILPTHALGEIPADFDVLVNKDSMPEIPKDMLYRYLQWTRRACRGFFYSYNQESAAVFDGEPQNVVAEAIADVGGFTLLHRDRSWVRSGYVEEIYQLGSCDATAAASTRATRS